MTSTDVYDIKWTMPHCVLTLRLIGVAIDMYDGAQKEVSKNDNVLIFKLTVYSIDAYFATE